MDIINTATAQSSAGFQAILTAIREVYSSEIYFTAQPNMRFDQFVTVKDELTETPGASITMQRMGNIKKGGVLREGQRMVSRGMAMSQSSISVDERGNAIVMTERLLQQSFYDSMTVASMALGRDVALVLDTELRDVFRTATTKVYAGGKTSRNSLVAGDVFGTAEIHRVSEALETNNSPKFESDFYVFFVHPHQVGALRQAPGWVNLQYYGNTQGIFYGEIGRYNDFRFISTSMMPNGANSALDPDTGDYADPGYDPLLDQVVTPSLGAPAVYQALAFGEYAVGHAVGLPVELRDNGVQDYGREHGLGWYAIWGEGLLEQKNIVVVETA